MNEVKFVMFVIESENVADVQVWSSQEVSLLELEVIYRRDEGWLSENRHLGPRFDHIKLGGRLGSLIICYGETLAEALAKTAQHWNPQPNPVPELTK